MRVVRLVGLLAATIAASLLIGFLKAGLGRLFRESFSLGAAASLVCIVVGFVVTIFWYRAIALRGYAVSIPPMSPQGQDLLRKFPGPLILNGPTAKWWLMTVLGVGMTAASVSACFLAFAGLHAGQTGAGLGLVVSALGAFFFGLCTAKGVQLVRHHSLQLDADGFEFFGLFRRRYQWSEVSDFDIFRYGANDSVVFKTTKPDQNPWSKMTAYSAGGRDGRLSGTYGLQVEDLAQLMRAWQSSASTRERNHPAKLSRARIDEFDAAL